jgi:glycosyltransferase involved in cell wall biosynthesis
MSVPKVSIIMPVLNGEKFIDLAIGSIVAQTFQDYELIVINDGSTDATCERLARFEPHMKLTILHHSAKQGIARSVNDGIRHARGGCIAFLDHDDEWFPEFLQTQVGYLEAHTEVGMVHSDFQTIDGAGEIIEHSVALCRHRRRPSGSVFADLFMDSFIVGNSVLIRKECFERLGGFDETLRWGDYHMWLRIARHYRVDYVPRVLTKYRQHASQQTRGVKAVEEAVGESVAMAAILSILDLYPEVRREIGERTIRRRLASLYFDMAYNWYMHSAFRNARICVAKGLWLWPTNWRYLALYASSLLRPSPAEAVRDGIRRVRSAFAR